MLSSGAKSAGRAERNAAPSLGFFVGYLIGESGFEFLAPQPPECLVFSFISPIGGELHRVLAGETASLSRKTFDYIRLLTHRPPRFVLHVDSPAIMTRHQSMREWPPEKYAHFSRNFFIETLAWLVRSALVRKFLAVEIPAVKQSRSTRS